MVNNFIGIYDDAVPANYCDDLINYYERLKFEGRTVTRQSTEGVEHIRKDNDIYYVDSEMDPMMIDKNSRWINTFCQAVHGCYTNYQQEVGVLTSIAKHGISESIAIQKTSPSQGYHVWHCEAANNNSARRMLMVILFLNDVEEGGETEFLYQRLRVKPKKGTILLCPAYFTHTHRGNPPLSGDKYIVTTWLEFME
jgi:hypothetical protein